MSVQDAEKAEAAANLVAAFMGTEPEPQQVVEAPPEAVSSPEVDDTPELDVEPAQSFEYSPEVPEDILREIQEAEIDDEVEQAVAARPVAEDENEYSEYEQGESEQELRARIKAEKRIEYLERELNKTRAKDWEADALKYFPLSKHKLADIQGKATSKRSFLKQAKAEHDAILPYVQEALGEAKVYVDGAREQAVAEGREAAAQAFGKPLSGPDTGTIDVAAANADLEQARRSAKESGSLVGLFRKMMEQGK